MRPKDEAVLRRFGQLCAGRVRKRCSSLATHPESCSQLEPADWLQRGHGRAGPVMDLSQSPAPADAALRQSGDAAFREVRPSSKE